MGPADFRGSPNMDDILSRIHDMNLSHLHPTLAHLSPANGTLATAYADDSKTRCTLDASFAISMPPRYPSKELDHDDFPTIIDTFAPKPFPSDLSPASSSSSEHGSVSSTQTSHSKSSCGAFVATRSRVVRLYNLPLMAESFLSAVFLPQTRPALGNIPTPISLWTLRESALTVDSIWAVFKTHEEALAALSLSGPAMSVTTAVESDLEPFQKLRRVVLKPTSSLPPIQPIQPISAHPIQHPTLRVSSSSSDLHDTGRFWADKMTAQKHDYTLSSNPPNPRSSFRIGDWMCTSPKCAAHNFGRNLVCIGCGCPRANNGASPLQYPSANLPGTRAIPSPRFASQNNYSPQPVQPAYPFSRSPSYSSPGSSTPVGNLPKPAHPLLTPSGQAFAIGGRVQNVSSDPLSPCIMYWPDNEPFPEQGQIRPNSLVGMPQPPILNTGNRGPISHQPGDWICKKCNYLNWRRRKVCQTCLPYAEGNGDSISAAVQAERIALLTSVLTQTQLSGGNAGLNLATSQTLRSHSSTPPQVRRPVGDPPVQGRNPVHRSQSHFELGAQYTNHPQQYANSLPIYQTSGHRQPSPLYSTGPELNQGQQVHAPAPLLPSFLQDIVRSPALSPTSSSSAELSFEEDSSSHSSIPTLSGRKSRDNSESSSSSPCGNIWRLDGEETKSLSAFALPNQQDLVGGVRRLGAPRCHLQQLTT
ncbi:hypothetical protein AX17_006167 [Amanita inopinata Kibby_2008]|nr:hypothetical protein AX17_006167 [Amanita inopinata Kibby_2008]